MHHVCRNGIRAHEDVHRRAKKGADYRLKDAVIELKILEEDGLLKPERQAKLAALFQKVTPERSVIVLDKNRLPESLHRDYNHILEGPIKTAVSKARAQLSQSREELDGTNTSILMIINNGYTALRHEDLMAMAANRIRHDTAEIDGLIVGGCYYYSDGFDSFYIWPLEYIPINVSKPFDFEALHAAWNSFSARFMTQLMQSPPGRAASKGHSNQIRESVNSFLSFPSTVTIEMNRLHPDSFRSKNVGFQRVAYHQYLRWWTAKIFADSLVYPWIGFE